MCHLIKPLMWLGCSLLVMHAPCQAQSADSAGSAGSLDRLNDPAALRVSEAYLNAAATAYANNIPVSDLEGRWVGFPTSRATSRALMSLEAESGFVLARGGQPLLGLSALVRSEGFLQASNGLGRIVAALQNTDNPQTVAPQTAELIFRQYTGYGVRIRSPRFPLRPLWPEHAADTQTPGPDIQMALDVFALKKIQTADFSGQIGLQGGVAHITASGEYASSSRSNAFLAPGQALGWGSSLSLVSRWPINPQLEAIFSAQDILSTLRWDRVYTETGRIDTQTGYTDAQGLSQFKPAISGRYALAEVSTVIPPRYGAALTWQPVGSAWFGHASVQRRWSMWQASTEVGRRVGDTTLQLGVDWVSRSLRVGAAWHGVQVTAAFDNARASGRLRNLTLSWGQPL